ncbi:hypothetical protein D3C80_1184350 [compost metagenome]
MSGHSRYRHTGSPARQQMACIAILPVADIFHLTEGCGYLFEAGQAKGSGVFKTPVAPCFCRQVNLAQLPIAQDELVLRQRLVATIGFGVQVEGHRAAIADFQQCLPCAIVDTFQSLGIGRIAQQNTMAGSCAHLGRQRNSIVTHPIYTEDFFHVRLVNHPKLFLVADTVIKKTEIFELSFLDARLCTTARHQEAFSCVKPQHALTGHVLSQGDVPTLPKADVLVAERVEDKPDRQFWPHLVITDEGWQVDT